MSTPSRSASAPKVKSWTPDRISAWLQAQQSTHPQARYDLGDQAAAHHKVAHALLSLTYDPSPLPLQTHDLPLLP